MPDIGAGGASVDVTPLWCQGGEVALDGAEPVVRPVVASVSGQPVFELEAEFVDAALVADDLGFGLRRGGRP